MTGRKSNIDKYERKEREGERYRERQKKRYRETEIERMNCIRQTERDKQRDSFFPFFSIILATSDWNPLLLEFNNFIFCFSASIIRRHKNNTRAKVILLCRYSVRICPFGDTLYRL